MIRAHVYLVGSVHGLEAIAFPTLMTARAHVEELRKLVMYRDVAIDVYDVDINDITHRVV